MQQNSFTGRTARTPEVIKQGDVTICNISLIDSEYAGQNKEPRVVCLQFKAFGGRAEALAKSMVGDLIQVAYRVENNNYKDNEDVMHYGHNFIITDFRFFAAGKARQDKKLADEMNQDTGEGNS